MIGDIKKLIDIYSNESVLKLKDGTCYLGIDPTGPGVHIGHILPMFLCLKLLDLGFKCIILIGGFTGQIGDPTGKSKSRDAISTDQVNSNSNSILNDVKNIFQNRVTYVNNNDWLSKMTLSELMWFFEKFSVTKKLGLDIFKKRIMSDNPLFMSEFTYPDLQAIDFYYLNQNHQCNIQIGGRDQWGNLSYGAHCLNRITNNEVYALATPLLECNGKKMGKSEGNACFIRDPAIYQFCLQMPDTISNWLCDFFFDIKLNLDPIEKKHRLGEFLMELYHGKNSVLLSEAKAFANSIKTLTSDDNIHIVEGKLSDIIYNLGLLKSKTEIKKFFSTKSIYINKQPTEDIILTNTEPVLLSIGKKKHIWICYKK